MERGSDDALSTLERVRELAVEQALASLREAQRVLAEREQQRQQGERALSELLQKAPPAPSTFDEITSMRQAELFGRLHATRVAACRAELQAAEDELAEAERAHAQRQQELQQARAELELVRRKLAARAQQGARERFKRADEAMDELVDHQRRRDVLRKPD